MEICKKWLDFTKINNILATLNNIKSFTELTDK